MQRGTHLLKNLFLRAIAGPVVRLAWFLAPKRQFDGITVGLLSPDPESVDTLFRKVHEALDMIATYDPKRLRRIQRDVQGLCVGSAPNDRRGSSGEYTRLCLVSETYVSSHDTSTAQIASTIVHEATHVRIYGAGIRVTQ